MIALYLLSNSNIELKSRFICSLYDSLNTDLEITEIFETIIFVGLKAVPHFAINALVKQDSLSDSSLFSQILSEKEIEPEDLIPLIEQYRSVQHRLGLYMVSKFCENLHSPYLQRNSHLSSEIFIMDKLRHNEFVKRACKLNQNFFLIPGIWTEAKKESNEMINILDSSIMSSKLDLSFKTERSSRRRNKKVQAADMKPRLIKTSRTSYLD